ncbi:MAG: hypothetical protein NT096_10560 [Proteobacteria bacterium]|nr:hypothetical protein [Pseudomonadota bacterium]
MVAIHSQENLQEKAVPTVLSGKIEVASEVFSLTSRQILIQGVHVYELIIFQVAA